MLETLQRIAQALQFLRLPALAVGLVCLASFLVILLTSTSLEGDRWLWPSLVGLIWSLSTHSFIATFRSVPEKADGKLGMLGTLGRKLNRGRYWLISVLFFSTTAVALLVTFRLVSFWLRDYAG